MLARGSHEASLEDLAGWVVRVVLDPLPEMPTLANDRQDGSTDPDRRSSQVDLGTCRLHPLPAEWHVHAIQRQVVDEESAIPVYEPEVLPRSVGVATTCTYPAGAPATDSVRRPRLIDGTPGAVVDPHERPGFQVHVRPLHIVQTITSWNAYIILHL